MTTRARPSRWVRVAGRHENWRGPRSALTLDEQLEIQRLFREATATHTRSRTAAVLAKRYGVSTRTIWRYVSREPIPQGLEFLRMRITDWARERDVRLTTDDMFTLMMVVARHRDLNADLVP